MDPKFLFGEGVDPWTALAIFGAPMDYEMVRSLFSIARKVVERTGLQANVLAVHTTKGYSRYRRATARLLRSLESENVIGFSTAYVPPPDTDAMKLGWLEAEASDLELFIGGRISLLSPGLGTMIPLVREVASVYPITYGYRYVIDKFYGPSLHATGMFLTHASRNDLPQLTQVERNRTARWCNRLAEAMPAGTLRDVFPLNLISEVHRKRAVFGVPLFEWIGQDGSRGRLENILPRLWAWHVADDKCVEMGDALEAAGLLA